MHKKSKSTLNAGQTTIFCPEISLIFFLTFKTNYIFKFLNNKLAPNSEKFTFAGKKINI